MPSLTQPAAVAVAAVAVAAAAAASVAVPPPSFAVGVGLLDELANLGESTLVLPSVVHVSGEARRLASLGDSPESRAAVSPCADDCPNK